LPTRDAGAAAALDERMKRTGKKMCNHWHLGGNCENGKFCQFQHEPKLTPAELNALRYKTRSLACKNRYCENIDCCKYYQTVLLMFLAPPVRRNLLNAYETTEAYANFAQTWVISVPSSAISASVPTQILATSEAHTAWIKSST